MDAPREGNVCTSRLNQVCVLESTHFYNLSIWDVGPGYTVIVLIIAPLLITILVLILEQEKVP